MDELLIDQTNERQDAAERSGVGPIVGTIIVVMLIVLGGLYFFINQAAKLHAVPASQQPANS
ncbi:MAG TPA: hypothetical protein VIJ88_03395 [Candidatus Paceibacterota bacterium]